MNGNMSVVQQQQAMNQSIDTHVLGDPGIPPANLPNTNLPLPGQGYGGNNRIMAGYYRVQKDQFTPPRPYFAGGNRTVNM